MTMNTSDNTSYYKNYFKDVTKLFSGNILAQLIGFFSIPFITRVYNPDLFGQYNLTLQIGIFCSIFFCFRMEQVIPLSGNPSKAKVLLKYVLLRSTKIFIVLILFSLCTYLILYHIDSSYKELDYILYAIVLGYLITISSGFQFYTQTKQSYGISSISEIILKSNFLLFALLIPKILILKPVGLLLAHMFALISKILFLSYEAFLKSLHNLTNSLSFLDKKLYIVKKEVVNKFKPMAKSVAISHVFLSATTLIPLFFFNTIFSASELGQVSLALNTIFLPTYMIGLALGNVYFERASKLNLHNKDLKNLWLENFKYLTIFSVPFFTFVFFIAPIIYPIFFGLDWEQAGKYAQIFAIPAMLSFISSPMDRTCLVRRNTFWGPCWHALRAITTLAVCMISFSLDLNSLYFVIMLASIMSLMYLLDMIVQFLFALNKLN